MRTICKVCHGKGSIIDPKYPDTDKILFAILGGASTKLLDSLPHIKCENCNGETWVGEPDVKESDPNFKEVEYIEPAVTVSKL